MVSTVTVHTDMAPSPRVDLFIDPFNLDGSTATISVHQTSVAGDFIVRDAERKSPAGGFPITDYEIPPGVLVSYRVEQFDAVGVSLGYAALSLTATVTVPAGFLVVSDPLAPGNAVMVQAESGFASALTHERPAKFYRAGVNTVGLMGLQSLHQDLVLRCITVTTGERNELASILAESLVLVRSGPEFPIPRLMYAVIPKMNQVPFDYRNGGTTNVWDLVGQEVSRPSLGTIESFVTLQRYVDAYATLADFAAAYSTLLDARLNPPPEV